MNLVGKTGFPDSDDVFSVGSFAPPKPVYVEPEAPVEVPGPLLAQPDAPLGADTLPEYVDSFVFAVAQLAGFAPIVTEPGPVVAEDDDDTDDDDDDDDDDDTPPDRDGDDDEGCVNCGTLPTFEETVLPFFTLLAGPMTSDMEMAEADCLLIMEMTSSMVSDDLFS